VEAFLFALTVGTILYFIFYPFFQQEEPTFNNYQCYIEPSASSKSMVDPLDNQEYVLIKAMAPTIRAQIDYHFAKQPGVITMNEKQYPYYKVWIDALSGDVKPAYNPNNNPGRGGAGFTPTGGVDSLRFVDVSADYPLVDKAYMPLEIYLLKGEPVPQFIRDYCEVELPVAALTRFQDTEGKSLPEVEIDTGSPSDWRGTAPVSNIKYVLFAYAKKGSKSLELAAGRLSAPVSTRTYTFTSGDKKATYRAAFLINSSTETITLENADPLAQDADIGYHYTRFELGPTVAKPVNLHQNTPWQTDMLQIEGFLPFQIPPWGWWTPECKPAVYLYPEKETLVNVQVTITNGFLTYTDPRYPSTGWSVFAKPSGELQYLSSNIFDSKGNVNYPTGVFPYLYYEGKVADSVVSKPEKGYVIAYDNLANFFDGLLPELGLNQKESQEFKEYWIKALPKASYYFIGIIPREQLDTNEPLTITPKEDTMIRVRLYFEALEKPKNVNQPEIVTPKRKGFTVVDWGGMVKRDTEHPFTCIQ